MKAFGILKTNPGLTTNIKIMVGKEEFSLSSIESSEELTYNRFKKVSINKNNLYDELIPYFYRDVDKDIAFHVRYENDNNITVNDFKDINDELYQYGAKNISNNKEYQEEYEYFAPIYIQDELPSGFIILRVDGPGLGDDNKDLFKNTSDSFKIVDIFDLSKKTNFGEWLHRNTIENSFFNKYPLSINLKRLEFSYWNGIDFNSGGYTRKSTFLDNFISEEKELLTFDKHFYDGFANNSIVCNNIFNLSFLFSDNPCTPDIKKKWSINRYYGFYINETKDIITRSPFKSLELNYVLPSGYTIRAVENRIVVFDNNNNEVNNTLIITPFSNYSEGQYVYINNEYYPVIREEYEGDNLILTEVEVDGIIVEEMLPEKLYRFKIITDKSFDSVILDDDGYMTIIDNIIYIKDISNNLIPLILPKSDFYYISMLVDNRDLNLKLKWSYDKLTIVSDYSIVVSDYNVTFRVGGIDTIVPILEPYKMTIKQYSPSDIKSFDNRILNTDYSRYEYESNDLDITDESKMYVDNLLSNSNPHPPEDFIYNGEVINIPSASEYASTHELTKVINDDLTPLWRKNDIYCRWNYVGSITSNDVPYILNNNLIFEDFNRTCDVLTVYPNAQSRNLDYFYTYNNSFNNLYTTLHINELFNSVDFHNGEFDKFFSTNQIIEDEITRVRKYSTFIESDTNKTLFRGLEFYIMDIDSIILKENNDIKLINCNQSNKWNNYEFSIIASGVKSDKLQYIKQWENGKAFNAGDIIMYKNVLFTTTVDISSEVSINPLNTPHNMSEFNLHNNIYNYNNTPDPTHLGHIHFDSATLTLNISDGIDYINIDLSINNNIFDISASYIPGDIVLHQDKYYVCHTASVMNEVSASYFTYMPYGYYANTLNSNPDVFVYVNNINEYKYYINDIMNDTYSISDISQWSKNSIPNTISNGPNITVMDGIIYEFTGNTYSYDLIPNSSVLFDIVKSFKYNNPTNTNGILYLNNSFVYIDGVVDLNTGINIHVNKITKKIVIEIDMGNTLDVNIKRSDMYNIQYMNLTANNIIESINTIDRKGTFNSHIKYCVTDSNGYNEYTYGNLGELPFILTCVYPNELDVKSDALLIKGYELPSYYKINNRLNNGVVTLNTIDYYNDTALYTTIKSNNKPDSLFINYNGMSDNTYVKIYRYDGEYMPLFKNIELFSADRKTFNTEVNDFGILYEKRISKYSDNSILKFKNNIYPIIDNFGYSLENSYIFLSTWDYKYNMKFL